MLSVAVDGLIPVNPKHRPWSHRESGRTATAKLHKACANAALGLSALGIALQEPNETFHTYGIKRT